jgi:hypothetical protein
VACEDDYLSEDELPGSQGSTCTVEGFEEHSRHKRHKKGCGESRHSYLPKVLGFSADDPGTDDWKEMRTEMMAKERDMPPKAFNQVFIERRGVLVEWMSQTSESVLNLVPITIHIAVAYLDAAATKLGDQYIKPSRLQLLATACILAAGTAPRFQ